MQITRIRIRDYQSIALLDLPIDSNTVLVGETDTGKSAVLRAITTLFTLPRGEAFIRDGAQSCEVALHLTSEQGETVIVYSKKRKVSASLSVFYPGYPANPAQTTKTWEACQELPPEIAAFGLSELRLDEDTWVHLNLADQLEQPFLLSNENLAAKVLGRLSFVDRVNAAMRKVNADVRRDNLSKPILEKDVLSLEKKLSGFLFLPEFKSIVDQSSGTAATVSRLDSELKELPLEKLQEEDLLVKVIAALAPGAVSTGLTISSEQAHLCSDAVEVILSDKFILDEAAPLLSAQIPSAVFPDLTILSREVEILLESNHTLNQSIPLISAQIPSAVFPDVAAVGRGYQDLKQDWDTFESKVDEATQAKTDLESMNAELKQSESALEVLKQQLGICPTCSRAF